MDVLLWITLVSCVAWLYLAFANGLFWRTDQRLRASAEPDVSARLPSVTVVVPARDEADVLAGTLPALLGQHYPGSARVVLVDDNSSDGTGRLATTLGRASDARLPLTVTSPGPPKPGWTGKLWALRHGMRESAVDTEYVLFTDADITHGPDSLARLVSEAQADNLDLVSVMARLRVATRWEALVVPAFVYFFGKLYPFRRVNRPGSRTAAAAGGCVLVRREALDRAGGVDAVRDAVIDDVSLGRTVKRHGGRGRIRLVLADPEGGHVDSVRPYPRLADLWTMVARTAFAQLGHSYLLLAGTVFGLALVYLAPPVALVAGGVCTDLPLAAAGLFAWALMTATYLPMVRYYRRRWYEAVALPFSATLYLGMTVDSARRHAQGRGAAWKGRTYPAPGTLNEPEGADGVV